MRVSTYQNSEYRIHRLDSMLLSARLLDNRYMNNEADTRIVVSLDYNNLLFFLSYYATISF